MDRPGTGKSFVPAERNHVKKRHWMLIAMLTAGTATFLYALLRRRDLRSATLYDRPEGGEREGEFELFIGS
ncbi:MAG TPA: hypothetical protein DDX05_06465 [Deltaproteobacteria bacterium]|nr:MAG: hypothetical protein A2X91_10465 [Deltaproteobacteria bacterium GWB2_65_81]OGP36769.1 MAG: hypothetical protein A2X98_02130 [Deltaproteobacteria bacterium GWC2_66_88]HBG73249.1 hypothetical protein [Deltaproteobacteria bacterium]